ncbi:hypothetical protein X777_11741 [Ooceraea biroi]|uniref:DNA-directed DNA polymerase n=1 Tax=Ooceraea biroi TaxID=2015173 RepID=A0A026W1B0_OOCBI|nr:hypothetical protein X777_11741 [Ooceraea biroi]
MNVRAKDNACFAWAVVAALYPSARHADRKAQYPEFTSVLDVSLIEFPMTLDQIGRFERGNDVSINVFVEDDDGKRGVIVPMRLTDRKHDRHRHVTLLYVPDGRAGQPGHFAWIRDLSRLVSAQLSKKQHQKYICDRCLHYFATAERLAAHAVDCGIINDCAIILPSEEDKLLTFRNFKRKERAPFVVYADLECTLEKNEDEEGTANTGAYQRHRAFSVGYYVRCAYDESLSTYRSYRGENCVPWFVGELGDLARRVKAILASDAPMRDLTPEQREELGDATALCYVCRKPFAAADTRVCDHCHLTGRYRGPAHSACNLNYKDSHVIPVIFHNLSGYDAHFIIEDVANAFEGSVELLPLTKKRYIAFTKNVANTEDGCGTCVKLRFVDLYKFLSASLDTLASYLDKSHMRILRRRYNLSRTGYKYLEIGIGVPPTLDTVTVHVAMGDTTGKKILLNAEMWKGLVDSRAIVCDYLTRANGEHVIVPPPMRMDDLTIRFASSNGQPTIRLDIPSCRLALFAPTVRYLYGLRHCAERVIATMASVVGRVEAKLRVFKHAAAGVEDPSDAPRAIRDRKDFDNNDLLDCELLVVVFGNI